MECQSDTSLITLDLSAFETVNHDILLPILRNKYGIHDKALNSSMSISYHTPLNWR